MSNAKKSRPPVVDEHGIEHRHGCPTGTWEAEGRGTRSHQLLRCTECGAVRLAIRAGAIR
ncbi:hypothetical protein IM660_10345 [Ruania alkalisoli]|uniref:Uncharacterized protein n=1 Tax=Ruania alkalisoli TaxID=2779775 RepID=A0A7M1SQ42_9MICO|nr:hypothetical protein [Ruania alkalisoli]QOR69134.1 hypothetical protein IM660_10345 [Ruania alkalisoli]